MYARETRHGHAGRVHRTLHAARRPPALIWQGWTAVWPAYRNQGLGHWLKAAMLDKLLRELPAGHPRAHRQRQLQRPDAEDQLRPGLQSPTGSTVWQVPLDQVDAYLAASGAGPQRRLNAPPARRSSTSGRARVSNRRAAALR